MSKKKRKYPRNRNSARIRTGNDVHHLLWIGRKWGFGNLASLRMYWYCKISIPRQTLHRFIHENVASIPVPSLESAGVVLRQLQELAREEKIHEEDKIERRIEVLIGLFDDIEPRTAEGLKRQLDAVYEFYYGPP